MPLATHPARLSLFTSLTALFLWGMLAPSYAQKASADSEVTILGEEGMQLGVDGKSVGRLPLGHPLSIAPGPHRFQLEAKSRRYESDQLMIPEGRAVELNLTRGTKGTAIAILTLRPMVLLAIRGNALDDNLRQALSRAAQEGVRAEHAALLIPDAASNKSTGLETCASGVDCLLNAAVQLEAKMILLLTVPAPAATEKSGARCGVVGEIFDVGTGQTAVKADADPSCLTGEDQILAATVQLSRRLLHEASSVSKGTIVVTTNPIGARVLLDNRLRGITPWQGTSLPGSRQVTVELEGYQSARAPITVLAGQTVKLPLVLVAAGGAKTEQNAAPTKSSISAKPESAQDARPPKNARRPRPRWRLAVGGALLGLGLLSTSFGIGGLSVANQPVDATCNCDYGTTGIGAGLLTVGLLGMAGGAVLIALPGPKVEAANRQGP